MSVYTQLTRGQRYQIYAFLKAGFSRTAIAKKIGVHKSTVSRLLNVLSHYDFLQQDPSTQDQQQPDKVHRELTYCRSRGVGANRAGAGCTRQRAVER